MHFLNAIFSIAILSKTIMANPLPQEDRKISFDEGTLGDSEDGIFPNDLVKLGQNQIDSQSNVPVQSSSDGQELSSSNTDTYQTMSDSEIQVNPVSDREEKSAIDPGSYIVSNDLAKNWCKTDPRTGRTPKRDIGEACSPMEQTTITNPVRPVRGTVGNENNESGQQPASDRRKHSEKSR